TPAGRHLHHRSVAGHLDLLPLGHGAYLPPAAPRRRCVVIAVIARSEATKIPWEWIATKSEARLRLQTHPTWRRRCCSIILPTDRPLSARSLAQFLCLWN